MRGFSTNNEYGEYMIGYQSLTTDYISINPLYPKMRYTYEFQKVDGKGSWLAMAPHFTYIGGLSEILVEIESREFIKSLSNKVRIYRYTKLKRRISWKSYLKGATDTELYYFCNHIKNAKLLELALEKYTEPQNALVSLYSCYNILSEEFLLKIAKKLDDGGVRKKALNDILEFRRKNEKRSLL